MPSNHIVDKASGRTQSSHAKSASGRFESGLSARAKMSKRSACEEADSENAVKKARAFGPVTLEGVVSSADLEAKLLLVQNDNLSRRLTEVRASEADLSARLNCVTERADKQEAIIGILLRSIRNNNKDVRRILAEADTSNEGKDDYAKIEENFETAYSFVQRCKHSSDLIISDEIKSTLAESVTNIKNLIDLMVKKENEDKPNKSESSKLENLSFDFLKNRAFISEFEFVKDRYSSCQEEINKHLEQIEDLTIELNKKNHRYEVLLNSYNKLLESSDKIQSPPIQNKNNEVNEELKSELISYREIAAARLEELKMLQIKYNETLTDYNKIKLLQSNNITDAKLSPEFKTLQYQAECAIADSHLLKEQVESYRELVEELMKQRNQQHETVRKNLREFRGHVKESLSKLNKELYNAKIELYKAQQASGGTLKNITIDDYFLKTMENLKNENSILKTKMINQIKDINQLKDEEIQNLEDAKTKIVEIQRTNVVIIEELENLTNLYEQIKSRNIELMQHIKENETAQLNTLTENLKLVQQLKTACDEKENVQQENNIVKTLVDACKKNVTDFQTNYTEFISTIDVAKRETDSAMSMLETYKKKIQEVMHKYVETNTQLERFKITQEGERTISAEWESRFENESFKNRRLNEDLAVLKRKLEKAHSNQYGGASDRILVEEVRMLKHKLTCHCCNARPKDAILTKCFHLFCFECLATTYNNRQRKCPRCGQSFGNHDFHKIYF